MTCMTLTGAGSAGAGEGSTPSPLLTDLVTYYKLDETSGTRTDSVNGYNLTDNNTVLFDGGAGAAGYARNFTAANDEFFNIASNSDLQTGDIDFWVAAWVYPTSLGPRDVVTKYGSGNSTREYLLGFNPSSQPIIIINDGTGDTTLASTHVQSTNTRIFLLAWHDSVNNTLNIRVGGQSAESIAYSSGGQTTSEDFRIGKWSGSATGNKWNGNMNSVVFGKSPPSGIANVIGDIYTSLYNNNKGIKASGISSSQITDWGVVSGWDLDEQSGEAVDSIGSNNLTDNNTVGFGDSIIFPNPLGYAANFVPANSEYLQSNENYGISLTGDFTLEAWVDGDLSSAYADYGRCIASYHTSAGNPANSQDWFLSVLADGTVRFSLYDATTPTSKETTGTPVSSNSRTHMVVRRSGGTLSIWINGTSEGLSNPSTGFSHSWGNDDLKIGQNHLPTSTMRWDGRIGPVRLWMTTALSDANIAIQRIPT